MQMISETIVNSVYCTMKMFKVHTTVLTKEREWPGEGKTMQQRMIPQRHFGARLCYAAAS